MFRDAAARRRQGPADRVARRGSPPTRSCRSRCSCWSSSPSPSTPTAASSREATPGLFWVAVLFSALLADPAGVRRRVGRRRPRRPAAVGARPGRHLPRQGRRHRGASCWPSRSLLGVGVVAALRRPPGHGRCCSSRPAWSRPSGWRPPVASTACSPPGLRVRETLLPLLLLPVVAPVLHRCHPGVRGRARQSPAEGWRWFGLLGVFALIYTGARSSPSARCWRTRDRRTRRLWRIRPDGTASRGQPGARHGRAGRPRGAVAVRSGRSPSTPVPDASENESAMVRIIYVHVPVAIIVLPRLRRHRARQRHVALAARPSSGTCWPPPRPRSAWCSPASRWSPARSGAARPGASCWDVGRPAHAAPRSCSCSSSATWPCAGSSPSRRARAALGHRRRCSPSSTCRSCTTRSTGGAACTSRPRSPASTRRSTA